MTPLHVRRAFLRALIAAPAGARFLLAQTAQPSQPAQSTAAATQPAPTPIVAQKIRPNLFVLSGDGGNIGVLIDGGSLMVIDTGYDNRSADLLKALASLDSHKVNLVFNTHWHLDHVGANAALGQAGAKIMAHDNVKRRVSDTVIMEALNNRKIDSLPVEGRPTQTFNDHGRMNFGKTRVEYSPVPPAHTDGDAYVFFPSLNVLHTGDLLFNGTYPLIDYSTGGWIGGMVAGCNKLLQVGDTQTVIIPGHGPVCTKLELEASRDMLNAVYTALQPLAKAGKTAADAVAAAPTKEYDARFGKGMKPDQFVTIAYTGMLRHQKG